MDTTPTTVHVCICMVYSNTEEVGCSRRLQNGSRQISPEPQKQKHISNNYSRFSSRTRRYNTRYKTRHSVNPRSAPQFLFTTVVFAVSVLFHVSKYNYDEDGYSHFLTKNKNILPCTKPNHNALLCRKLLRRKISVQIPM